MPLANEHSARVKSPEEFQQGTFRRSNSESGVDIITGKLISEDVMAVQSYRFDISKFTAEQAKKWCKDHEVNFIDFEPSQNAKVIEGHIFVYGEIVSFQDSKAGEFGCVNLKNIVQQIKDNKDATRLICHIHSPGGDVWEGFAIHDALVNSGKEVETIIEGLCASIATVIALAGDKRLMTQHSEFMIHNPWTFGIGDSEDLKKQSEELSKTENKLADFYAAKTSLTSEQLLNYMHNETFFTADEAKDFGFITEVVNTMKQVASINKSKFYNSMSKEQDDKMNLVDKLFNRLEKLFQKNIMVADVNGKELEFPDLTDASEIKVGAKVNEGGSPANGEHQMPGGETYVCENGTLKEIKEKPADDTQALKDENAALKAEIEKLKGEKASVENKLKTAEADTRKAISEYKAFKAEFSKGDPDDATPPAGDPKPKTFPSKDELRKSMNL